jgi:hypothetical protein
MRDHSRLLPLARQHWDAQGAEPTGSRRRNRQGARPLKAYKIVQVNPGTIQAARALAMMDKETKREMWFLAIGTALLEAPVVAIVALMVLTH